MESCDAVEKRTVESDERKRSMIAIVKTLATNAGVEMTSDVLRLYSMALRQFTVDQIEAAAVRVLQTWRYTKMPPVAVLIDNIPGGKPPSIEHRALSEANKILAHLHYHGASADPFIEDPITRHLMTRRWPYRRWASTVLESEIKWWVKEFVEAYQATNATGAPDICEIGLDNRVAGLLKTIGSAP